MAKKIIKKAKPKKMVVKKAVKKTAVKKVKKPHFAKASRGKEKLLGLVTHYFSNIEVSVIKLKDSLQEGDKIRIIGGEKTDFNQTVKSMQIDHEKVKVAKKGSSVGLKVKEQVREGYKVFKI